MMKKLLPILIIGVFVLSSIGGISVQISTEKYETSSLNADDENTVDLLVIAPRAFNRQLQRFVEHKEKYNIATKLVNVREIYDGVYFETEGRDEPEQIKYFIKNALETWNISYVLLFGGLKNKFYAKPRDNLNSGVKDWYVPVRYTNVYDEPEHPLVSAGRTYDPGVISDLYYADIYDSEGNFSSWDPNEDDIFAAWNFKFNETDQKVEDDLPIDLEPDVVVSRLPCRSIREVKIVVDKIINYETTTYGQEWFKKMMVFSGDGFLDQKDLDFQWNTSGLSDGEYRIYGQSFAEDEGQIIEGNINMVTIKIDRDKKTELHVTHDDHLQNPEYNYPNLPIAEITVPSNGDILGKNDKIDTNDSLAYGNDFSHWTDIEYVNGIMHIRGKSYNPIPYGNLTDIKVWILNEENETVFSEWRYNTETYYEGEWVTGQKVLNGRGGALYYMPDEFKKEIYWASNGGLTGQQSVINALSKGAGFVFMSGHGSPNVWADHYPGVPGDRRYGGVDGLAVTNMKLFPPFIETPLFPMNKLSNGDELPVVVVGGCHNSQFNVSMIKSIGHGIYKLYFSAIEKMIESSPLLDKILPGIIFKGKETMMWTYGAPVSECYSWRLISLPNKGAIATLGNTGLGYGRLGENCTSDGGDAWITTEFFRQYGTEGHEILGDAFMNTQKSYIHTFEEDMFNLPEGHAKTVQQLVLFGDPTLKIGGYKN
jgi:hypothetical protein